MIRLDKLDRIIDLLKGSANGNLVNLFFFGGGGLGRGVPGSPGALIVNVLDNFRKGFCGKNVFN